MFDQLKTAGLLLVIALAGCTVGGDAGEQVIREEVPSSRYTEAILEEEIVDFVPAGSSQVEFRTRDVDEVFRYASANWSLEATDEASMISVAQDFLDEAVGQGWVIEDPLAPVEQVSMRALLTKGNLELTVRYAPDGWAGQDLNLSAGVNPYLVSVKIVNNPDRGFPVDKELADLGTTTTSP